MTSKEIRDILKTWLIPALTALGGSAHYLDVYKNIWSHHKYDISNNGDMFFYRWQYELSHAAAKLRKEGVMEKDAVLPKGVWALK
ncbi:MAG: hypothetical protein KZQ82_18725 [Candidatus Thiodiazotropha sp. (ex Lucinoma annulata)]|nr:hypothetical protein [Candidatus Thiodiazotropha sp. (ex Lucinoma annulata)]